MALFDFFWLESITAFVALARSALTRYLDGLVPWLCVKTRLSRLRVLRFVDCRQAEHLPVEVCPRCRPLPSRGNIVGGFQF